MDTAVLVVIVAALLAILLIAMLVTARGRGGWLTKLRRVAAFDARDDAAEIDRAAAVHTLGPTSWTRRPTTSQHAMRGSVTPLTSVNGSPIDFVTTRDSSVRVPADQERHAEEIDPEIADR